MIDLSFLKKRKERSLQSSKSVRLKLGKAVFVSQMLMLTCSK